MENIVTFPKMKYRKNSFEQFTKCSKTSTLGVEAWCSYARDQNYSSNINDVAN